MPVDERSTNAFLPSPDTVLADASDIFRARHAQHQVARWTTVWTSCATRRLRCAQPGERTVERVGLALVRGFLPGKTRSTGCAEEILREYFPPSYPQPESTGGRRAPVDNSTAGSSHAGSAELIIFDGVFDRRGRSQARGRGHRPARCRPQERGFLGPGGTGRRHLGDGARNRPGASPASLRLCQSVRLGVTNEGQQDRVHLPPAFQGVDAHDVR